MTEELASGPDTIHPIDASTEGEPAPPAAELPRALEHHEHAAASGPTEPAAPAVAAEPAAPSLEDDEIRPSAEFAKALENYERKTAAAASTTRDVIAGSKVRGTLVSIGDEHSMIDFGGRSEGVVETRFLKDEAGALKHGIGDVLELFVMSADDQVVLAPSLRAEPHAALQQLRESHRNGIPVTGRVSGKNAGGLEIDVAGVRGFCPISQIEAGFCADPSVHIGRTYDFLVTEIRDGRNVVVSRRALLQRGAEEAARALIATLKPGDEIEGTVARLEPFGAFVDLGGVDGLVHVSEIRHERTGHPREALATGNKVKVRVLKLERGKDGKPRIALSIKAATPDPWADVDRRFLPGTRVAGTVVRLTDFGAFVNLAPGIDGLVHVSEAATPPVAHVKDALTVNQQVEAIVLAVDPAKKRISLSLREATAASAVAERSPEPGERLSGFISGIKPFGLFIDLPACGRRARGLVPRDETGAPRDMDLAKQFAIGDAVEVEVLEVKDDRIRLSLRSAEERAAAPARPRSERPARMDGGGTASGGERPGRTGAASGGGRERGERTGGGAGAGRAGRGAGAGRGGMGTGRGDRAGGGGHTGRGDRGDRGDRSDRGDRGSRQESRFERPAPAPTGPPELTTMALALRKAMEKAAEKNRKG